ncbi:phosphoglycerate kinase [Candidatus Woesearchaeota archaeon]|nr:phosphoglycerate kinase [Candidatus Woesearchaeota archaeon]
MRSVKSFKVKNKRVLVRVDFNVPLDKKGKITDDKRIKAALPTIQYLIKNKAMVILISHLGRPDGEIVPELKMENVAQRLSDLLNQKVYYIDDCIGHDVEDFIDEMIPGEVVLLENVRFYEEEKANDPSFSLGLAELADLYVNDAFGTCHRAHASVEGITNYLPSAAGFLLKKEIDTMTKILRSPKHPFIAIMGGVKVSDKIEVINSLLKKVDALLIGGAMMFTFYKAMGIETSKSIVEKDKLKLAADLLKKQGPRKKIILPTDTLAASKFDRKARTKIVDINSIPKNMLGVDIGPETIAVYKEVIAEAKTIIWNGPLGVSEIPKFAKGTNEIAKALASSKATTLIGGGDSAAAIEKLKLEKKFTHVSTGGGASLEFLEGKPLPAITALELNKIKFKS